MGITDYLSRSPCESNESGDFDDGTFTIVLIEHLNQRKNERSRIFGKLIRKRKKIREKKQNRAKEQRTRNKVKLRVKKHKRENEAGMINKIKAQPNEFDDVITNYFFELVEHSVFA